MTSDAREIAAEAAPIGHGKLQWRILIGFVAGLVAGLLVYTFFRDAQWVEMIVTYVTNPIGQIFLRLLFMLVIPLLFSALVVGIAEMGEIRALKRIGVRTLIYTVIVSSIAVAISIALVNLLQPGRGGGQGGSRRAVGARGGGRIQHRRSVRRKRGRGEPGHRHRPLQRHFRHVEQRYFGGDVLRPVLWYRPAAGANPPDGAVEGRDRGRVRGRHAADRHRHPIGPDRHLLFHVQFVGAVRLGLAVQARGVCRRGPAGARHPDVRRVPALAEVPRQEEPVAILQGDARGERHGVQYRQLQRHPADSVAGRGYRIAVGVPRKIARFVLTIGATAIRTAPPCSKA